ATDAGAAKVPSPRPSRTNRLLPAKLVMMTSTLPSSLKSAATPRLALAVSDGPGEVEYVPSSLLNRTVVEVRLTTNRSGLESPLKSPTITLPDRVPVAMVCAGAKTGVAAMTACEMNPVSDATRKAHAAQ